MERVGVEDNFFELGGDSILSIQVVSRARVAGVAVTHEGCFLRADGGGACCGCGVGSVAGLVDGEVVVGPAPLTPIQRWFFARMGRCRISTSRSRWSWLRTWMGMRCLPRWVRWWRIITALRMRFFCVEGAWSSGGRARRRWVGWCAGVICRVWTPGDRQVAWSRRRWPAQSGLDITDGPLVRVVLFDLGPGQRPWLFIGSSSPGG